jgi:ribonuclease HI
MCEQSASFLQAYLISFQRNGALLADASDRGKSAIVSVDKGKQFQKKETCVPWIKPDSGWTKLNVDASFSADENSGTWGAVIRDEQDVVIICAWGVIERCAYAEIVEALACLEGVKAVLPLSAKPIQLETDCSVVLHELFTREKTKSQIACIIQEVKNISQDLHGVHFCKVNRTVNRVAHSIASFSRSSSCGGLLLGLVRPYVEEPVRVELL